MKLVNLGGRVWVNPEHVTEVTHDGGRDVVEVWMVTDKVHTLRKPDTMRLGDYAMEIRHRLEHYSEGG